MPGSTIAEVTNRINDVALARILHHTGRLDGSLNFKKVSNSRKDRANDIPIAAMLWGNGDDSEERGYMKWVDKGLLVPSNMTYIEYGRIGADKSKHNSVMHKPLNDMLKQAVGHDEIDISNFKEKFQGKFAKREY